MTFKELCEARYSVRAYEPAAIPADKLTYVMECARLAPSAVNKQPWRLHIADTPDDLAKAASCYKREWIQTAPAIIIVSVEKGEAWTRSIDGKYHGDIDAAIIAEHICLAAAEQGLGTCWVCNFDAARLHDLFAMDDNQEPVVMIPIGYPADHHPDKHRKPLTEIFY